MTDLQFGQLLGEFKGVTEKLDTLSDLITGNGEPAKGVVVRLDRVEQRMRRALWAVKALFVAAAGAICTFGADWILSAMNAK